MRTAFLMTSALNTRFGVYATEERINQTLDSIYSIKKKIPDAKIYLLELAGISPSMDQVSKIAPHVTQVLDLSKHKQVQAIYHGTNSHDIVKNLTEVFGTQEIIRHLQQRGEFNDVDRIFKISGRYLLSEAFSLDTFASHPDKIVIARRRGSQFAAAVTGGVTMQYMSRLWSWPTAMTTEILQVYQQGLHYMADRMKHGGYCDIEHMLFKFLPADRVVEVSPIGVQGCIAPTGVVVHD